MLIPPALERRIGRGTAVRLCALVDQGATGIGNIVVLALVGRTLPVAQFGIVGIAIGLLYFIAGFHRSAIVLPFITDPRGAASHARDSGWWWLAWGGAMALALGVVAIAALIATIAPPGWRWAVTPLLLAALMIPAQCGWEFTRRWLYTTDRADLVAAGALVSSGLLCLLAWLLVHVRPDAFGATLAWVGSGFAAILLMLPALRPTAPDRAVIARLVAEHGRASAWLAAGNLPYAVYSSASVVVPIGALIGPVSAALFTAARTITNPAISIVSAIDSIDKPRAAHALAVEGLAGLRRRIARMRRLIALATGAYLGIVALTAEPLLRLAFHHRFPGLADEVRLLALAFFLFGLTQPAETLLIVLRAGRTLMAVRIATAVVTLAALVAARAHGVAGMAAAICASQATGLLLLSIAEHRLAARRTVP